MINVTLLMAVIAITGAAIATMYSPDALEVFARKMRARACAMRAARIAWEKAYTESLSADKAADCARLSEEMFR
jgi:hypothetical protein